MKKPTGANKAFSFSAMMNILHNHFPDDVPSVTKISQQNRDPFLVLIGTLLSLRTKDEVTEQAMDRLSAKARTPKELLRIPENELAKIIYPVGFYKTKAQTLRNVSKVLLDKYEGEVPDTLDDLLELKGVGRKTANLIITEGFGKPGICVDTHVHRISNRLGVVATKNPHETEFALRKILPLEYWISYNTLLVTFGKRICKPISPLCSVCPILSMCNKVGVTKHR